LLNVTSHVTSHALSRALSHSLLNASSHALSRALSHALRIWRDILLPRGCAGCDRPDEVLCADCRALFEQCRRRELSEGRGEWVLASAVYQGAVRHAILAWKDHDDTELDGPFGAIMAALCLKSAIMPACTGKVVMVVPAPSSRDSMRRRGRWHTVPLARAAVRALRDNGVDARVVKALASTATGGRSVQQSSSAGRARRVGGHIVVDRRQLVPGAAVILVDDIITTGSTLRQCILAFERADVSVLGALALAEAVTRRPDAETG
jgi:predicted amidophosphoribosyltransferase